MTKKTTGSPRDHRGVSELRALDDLHLDTRNPRFGGLTGSSLSQAEVLDIIVDKFGIEDVLSSLAVNGYFDAEPLVGLRERKTGQIRIVEGNRRLAACLILANDERAANQGQRVQEFQALQKSHHRPPIKKVPVRIFEESEWRDELLPYLGVRHIAASQPWDSYAKASWIAQVLDSKELTLDDVVQMIGDQHRTTPRMLEGYYFIRQLIDAARFTPTDSLRKGRGSNPEYPFSWVYTALGYSPVRRWLGLDDLEEEKKNPVPEKNLDDAEDFMVFLFGNKTKNRPPAINDSRNIADLAKAVAEPARRQLLRRGKTVDEVIALSRPPQDRIVSGLMDAQDALESVSVTLSAEALEAGQAEEVLGTSKKVLALARDVHKKIGAVASGPDGESDD